MQSDFIIPGYDRDVKVHGEMPALWNDCAASDNICVHDMRAAPLRFGDHEDRIVREFAPRMGLPWVSFNHVLCSADNVLFDRQRLQKDGKTILGAGRTSWETKYVRAAEESGATPEIAKGDVVPDPVQLEGKSGFVWARSMDNYYHFVVDTLPFLEAIFRQKDALGLDRIIVGPGTAPEGGFALDLLRCLWPDWADRIVFLNEPFEAEELTWCTISPDLFQRDENGKVVFGDAPRGVSGRRFFDAQRCVFERADHFRQEKKPAEDGPILLVSRSRAATRKLVNENALYKATHDLGVEKVFFEDMTFEEKMNVLSGARAILGVHGAGMINAGFCRPGTPVVEITARNYLKRATWVAKLAFLRDTPYHLVIGDEEGEISKISGNVGNDIVLSEAALSNVYELIKSF
ncbi:MAG: DUF563 domain-containing protein [Paracoccaceae bacterium]